MSSPSPAPQSRVRNRRQPNRDQRRQGVYWIFTIPFALYQPYLPPQASWIRGQLEEGTDPESESRLGRYSGLPERDGYIHWQLVCNFRSKQSLRSVRSIFGDIHAELTKCDGANSYVWKDDTAIPGTRFELGIKPFNRSSETDWERVYDAARRGAFDEIPASLRVVHYRTFCQIFADHVRPVAMERVCTVYWGASGVGKTRRAYEEAGVGCYIKPPTTKWFCGYRGERHVIIDEFRGSISIEHILRWLDRYPCSVEKKGIGNVPWQAEKIWITSNLHPSEWYPDVNPSVVNSLFRRMTIINLT